MTNIQKILTSRFGSLAIDVIRTGQTEPGITRKQLGEMLGYKNPDLAVKDIHARNTRRFDDSAKCAIIKMPDSIGREVNTYLYTFKGVLEVCRYSTQPNAHAVMDWAWNTLDRLRKGELPASTSRQIESLKTRLLLAEQKLQLFEEYNEDILYDFDQVAAAMRIYRKPPFGASHLKKWLAEKKILCSAHYKNDKPIQRYIDLDWFRLVMHEWKRHGRRRYEPRYLITQRGFNGMIDLAIRERVIDLPVPKNYCLPYLSEPLPPEVDGRIDADDDNGSEGTVKMATVPALTKEGRGLA
jgi:phage antirepressor YoqD-like protein